MLTCRDLSCWMEALKVCWGAEAGWKRLTHYTVSLFAPSFLPSHPQYGDLLVSYKPCWDWNFTTHLHITVHFYACLLWCKCHRFQWYLLPRKCAQDCSLNGQTLHPIQYIGWNDWLELQNWIKPEGVWEASICSFWLSNFENWHKIGMVCFYICPISIIQTHLLAMAACLTPKGLLARSLIITWISKYLAGDSQPDC